MESKPWTYYLYNYWNEETDPRVKEYFLLGGGPKTLLLILIPYLLFSAIIGPWIMKNRKPFELRNIMLIYNIFMVISNAYFFFKSLKWLNYGLRIFEFEFPSGDDNSPETMVMIYECYLYGLTKLIDLLDTIFFVLRKKDSQVTFLHLYHHTIVPLLAWIAGKLCPTCVPIAVFALLNTSVHVIMYSYYSLATFGPKIQKYLWWKKYITLIQLTQFMLLIAYGIINAMFATGWPMGLYIFGWIQNPFFFYLFYDFYRQSYNRKNTSITKKSA